MPADYAGWYRVGGRRIGSFYATADEIAEWLVETLPDEFAPYAVIGEETTPDGLRRFEDPLDRIRESFARRTPNHWIRSDVLSPHVPAGDGVRQSFAGLILVQVGRERNGRVEDTSLAIVDRIRHEQTGEERVHRDYLRIFERLRRSIRKRLVVRTKYTFPSGEVGEHWPMTARAADAHVRGEITFSAEPVGLRD